MTYPEWIAKYNRPATIEEAIELGKRIGEAQVWAMRLPNNKYRIHSDGRITHAETGAAPPPDTLVLLFANDQETRNYLQTYHQNHNGTDKP
jgi:hypothetical protein